MMAVTADTAAALANRLRALLSWVTNSLCLDTNGEMRASDGPVLTRTSWDSAEADTAASVRKEAMRSGPALWGWFSCSWTWERKVDPTPDTVPAAALRSWTARNCRPSTGRMATGAKRGDERSV